MIVYIQENQISAEERVGLNLVINMLSCNNGPWPAPSWCRHNCLVVPESAGRITILKTLKGVSIYHC